MRAADLMTREIVTLGEDATVGDAIAMIGEHEVRHLPIVREGKPIALVSDRDLRAIEGASVADIGVVGAASRYDAPVLDIAQGELVMVRDDALAREAIDAMLDAHVSSVLVVDGAGMLVGIITTDDVLRAAREVL